MFDAVTGKILIFVSYFEHKLRYITFNPGLNTRRILQAFFSTFQNYTRCKIRKSIAVFMRILITNMQKRNNSTIGWIGSWFYGIHHFVLSTCDYKRYKLIVYDTIFNLWLNSVFILYAWHHVTAETFNKPESFLSYNIYANRFRISRLNQPQIVFDIKSRPCPINGQAIKPTSPNIMVVGWPVGKHVGGAQNTNLYFLQRQCIKTKSYSHCYTSWNSWIQQWHCPKYHGTAQPQVEQK